MCVYICRRVVRARASCASARCVGSRCTLCFFLLLFNFYLHFFLLCAILCALLALARKLRECSLCTFALRVVISFLIICFYFLLLLCNFFCVRFFV